MIEKPDRMQLVLINLVLATLYFGLAKLGLLLALPPGYGTAIWPPSGLAFAACLIWGGRQVWPGILLGSLITNATIGGGFNLNGLALTIAMGSTVQALIGEVVLRRVDARMELDHARAVGRFVAVTLLTCLVATTVGNAGLYTVGYVNLEQLPRNFITWWLGDSLGVLIFLPLTLVLVDPRPLWRHRRFLVGVPLLSTFLLCGLVYQVVRNDEVRRLSAEFEAEAAPLLTEWRDFNTSYSRALHGGATLLGSQTEPTAVQFYPLAMTIKRNYPLFSAISWEPLLRQDDLPPFQTRFSTRLERQVVVRPLPGQSFADDGWSVPIAMIEPLTGNEAVLDRDLLSEPTRAATVRKAWQSGQIAASAKIQLLQDADGPGGLLLIAPIKTADARIAGFLSGVVNLRDLLRSLYAAKDITWALHDVTAGRLIHGTISTLDTPVPDFATSSHLDRQGVYLKRALRLADRELSLVLFKPHSAFATQAISISSVVLFMALLINAGLGMFALVVSASAGRIAGEVEQRTRQLREEIARRERGEQMLQDSVRHTQAILDNAVDGIITIDAVGTVGSFNRAAEGIFGYTAEEVIGQNVKMLMPEPYRSEHDGYLNNYHTTGVPRIIGSGREVEGRRKDGSHFPMDLAVSKSTHQGRPLFVGLVRDISERRRIEQMKTEFVSTVSHELRTPLTSISGSLGLVVGGALGDVPAMMKPMLDIAHKNCLRLAHLIDDLLDMEKLVAGKAHFEFQVQPLMPLIEQVLESTRAYGAQLSVTFCITERRDSVNVRVDGDRLHQVLANFLSNAAKFSPTGAEVQITVRTEGERVRVTVIDHGPGLPEDFRARVFQKFSQADSSDTRQKGGTGLGLAITKELIERMSGSVGFQSELGQGASFYFELPVWPTKVG